MSHGDALRVLTAWTLLQPRRDDLGFRAGVRDVLEGTPEARLTPIARGRYARGYRAGARWATRLLRKRPARKGRRA